MDDNKIMALPNGAKKSWNIEGLLQSLEAIYQTGREIAETYSTLMYKDSLSAIKLFPQFVHQAKNINPNSSFVECVAGGPNHEIIGPILQVVGEVYPTLEKNIQKEALIKVTDYLVRLNSFYAQNHVAMIDEPWLVADIIVNYPRYWPGFERCKDLLQKHPRWTDFSKHISKESFWMAVAVTRTEYASLDIKFNFYKKFPRLLDRTKDAIAAFLYNETRNITKNEQLDLFEPNSLEEGIHRKLRWYDALLHEDICRKLKESKWINLR